MSSKLRRLALRLSGARAVRNPDGNHPTDLQMEKRDGMIRDFTEEADRAARKRRHEADLATLEKGTP